MNRKKVITILIIILVLMLTPILCCGGFLFYSFEIEPRIWSIDAEMEEDLKTKFDIELPEEYVYVDGEEEDGGFDDDCDTLYLYLIIDEEDFEDIFVKGWKKIYHGLEEVDFMGKTVQVEKERYYYRHIDEQGNEIGYGANLYYKIVDGKVHCYFDLPIGIARNYEH